ncbi:MAG: hypothetical protein AAF945_07575 [Actinomycetota bacterium]
MNTISRPRARQLRRLGVATTAVLVLAACGSDDSDAGSEVDGDNDAMVDMDDMPEETADMADDAMDDEMGDMDDDAMDDGAMGDMDMMDMNMGDPNATPADEVEGAALASGEFALLDTRPQGYDDLAGTAAIARHDAGTTVTTEITGLLPNVEYISHVHELPCSDENGGDHFQFVEGDVEVPPNEIHLAFTSDNDGNGFMTAENDAVAGETAVSFVVHPREFIDNKIACVDFVADDDDAVAEAIANGPAFDPALLEGHEGMDMGDMDMDDSMDEMDEMDDESMDEMDDGDMEMQEDDDS